MKAKDRERGKRHEIWEDSFDWKECRINSYMQQKLSYIHQNPYRGKWNLAPTPLDYVHSSAKFYATGEQGIYSVLNYCELADIDLTKPLQNDAESTPPTRPGVRLRLRSCKFGHSDGNQQLITMKFPLPIFLKTKYFEMKIFIIPVIFILNTQYSLSQRQINLTIRLNKNIDAAKISCSYYNGKKDIIVTDKFINNILFLKGNLFSEYASFHIEYKKANDVVLVNDFFINEKPAKIEFSDNNEFTEKVLKYSVIINALPIYDTMTNYFFKQLSNFRKNEAKAVSDFLEKNGAEINTNDSLSRLSSNLFKTLNNRTISFFRSDNQNYFSFWYFRTQVVGTAIVFSRKDAAYLKSLIDSLDSIFPEKYSKSFEGQQMVNLISRIIHPPILNTIAPDFSINDITGKKIQLSNYKGKFILLDFWASWCPPCLKEIPFFKKIRNDFPYDKLTIIGINADRTITACKAAVKKNSMNWVHIFDDEGKIMNLFGVDFLPVTILINKEGDMLYNSKEKEDKQLLLRLLDNM